MASTFSPNLSIELIGTGDQAGTWGTTTNSNLGTLIEQAISGYVTQAVATGTDTTITIPNGSTGVARNMYIELTGTGGASTNLIVPANKKLYFIFNNSTGAVTVKVSGQTGVSVPTGKKMVLVSNGTDIVNGLNYIADFGTNSFSVTNLTASSATITNLIATSGSITNLVSSDASATVLRAGSATLTHLSATSASITNLALTSLTISSLSITNVSVASVTVSSVATFAAGSAAAPSITTTGDTNTGIFFPAADTIAFTEGGTESMRVDSSGRLLVGQTGALNNGTIDVLGTGRQAIVARVTDNVNSLFQGFNSSAVATFQVDGSGNGYFAGNLGIGTTSPLRRLAIAGDAQVYNTAADGASNTVIGRLTSQVRNYGTNIATASFASIEFATGTWPTGNIRFLTNGTDGTDGAGTERMRLDSSGNLGLGVTPSAWGSTWKALQISNWASLGAETSSTGECTLLQNAYASGASTFNYIGSFAATRYTLENSAHKWYTAPSGTAGNTISFTQAMTLDASGNLGIGTSSPAQRLDVTGAANSVQARFGNVAGRGLTIGTAVVSGTNDAGVVFNAPTTEGTLIFQTNSTERARITSGGDLCVGSTSALGKFDVYQTALARAAYLSLDNASNTSDVLRLDCSRNTTNNSYNFLLCAVSGVATRLTIADSGNVANTNGTYGTLSDARLKQDIVDAGSQWDDLKAVRFRKYRMKTDVQANPDSPAMLGVVAQELETVCPGLVENQTDRDDEGNDLGTTTKIVKSSILLMKAAVALQEAMARIEQLEAKFAALESK